jgi:hypothetical protein
VFQFLPHEPGRIEQLEADIAVIGPALQKYEHANDPASDGVYFREIQHQNTGSALGHDRIAQLESGVIPDKSAFALNHGHISYVVNMYVWHDFPPM